MIWDRCPSIDRCHSLTTLYILPNWFHVEPIGNIPTLYIHICPHSPLARNNYTALRVWSHVGPTGKYFPYISRPLGHREHPLRHPFNPPLVSLWSPFGVRPAPYAPPSPNSDFGDVVPFGSTWNQGGKGKHPKGSIRPKGRIRTRGAHTRGVWTGCVVLSHPVRSVISTRNDWRSRHKPSVRLARAPPAGVSTGRQSMLPSKE